MKDEVFRRIMRDIKNPKEAVGRALLESRLAELEKQREPYISRQEGEVSRDACPESR